MRLSALAPIALVVLAGLGAACSKRDDAPPAAATVTAAPLDAEGAPVAVLSSSAKLAVTAMVAHVVAKPAEGAKRLGYLRLGAVVARSEKSYGTDGCEGGWYAVAPRGFVCVGKTASLDTELPIVKAASVRPDTSKPLPYAYGFVRAVAPLYLRLPTPEEALRTEFKLEQHMSWWNRRGDVANHIDHLGANDAARELFADAPPVPPPPSVGDGILLGGTTERDPVPFWLANGSRAIPNVSGFDVPPKAFFANRVKRHTGIAFIGSFATGPEHGGRRFAVTVDMRLAPVDKLKPEVASTFHGIELKEGVTLPVAYARPCNPASKGTPKPCVQTFRDEGGTLKATGEILPTRAFLELTGKDRRGARGRYLETKKGTWVRASDVGIATAPATWPHAAERGDRWIDVSIEEQTLVLWEGKMPVFATAVSTGRDLLEDPKTSTATPLGTFRIKAKHVTTTMDSNGRSAQSGGAAPTSGETALPTDDDKHAGNFELRDVPYVQYFHEGYALHAAYWHDHFGHARSHGCVNLAPIDALRVFRFSEPAVPEGWHGTNADPGKGTPVVIRK